MSRQLAVIVGAVALLLVGVLAGVLIATGGGSDPAAPDDTSDGDTSLEDDPAEPTPSTDTTAAYNAGRLYGGSLSQMSDPTFFCQNTARNNYSDDPTGEGFFLQGCLAAVSGQ